ncbi:hypothetical protein LshimejAT787_1602360 [Lyophyllum shimeji]|uniref:Uncharacterized protein n=1 Tax=Lyophyllum shimeji TaxID=47721 RepID=A0A9P3UVM7_LYOSH|nr:hypothetical protein LshimejAT787_1602360 [Lyophyllum shimeji]
MNRGIIFFNWAGPANLIFMAKSQGMATEAGSLSREPQSRRVPRKEQKQKFLKTLQTKKGCGWLLAMAHWVIKRHRVDNRE